jgi:hypothetical protein
MFPRDRVIKLLTKYNVPFGADEYTVTLRNKLRKFYAQLTHTKAACLLASEKLSKTQPDKF